MWQSGWRERAWAALDDTWDIIIIGGGITGAGILREATRAGLRALLFEAHDFAGGTSSRSSKLVHGGFRYLRNAQIRLTYESVRERERLLKEGRGLVNPLGCLLVNYQGDELPAWVFGLGLSLYDILALKWGHRRYDGYDMRALCPALCDTNLSGGYRYFDAQTDDARLVLRIIQESIQDGGAALNYAPVKNFVYQGGNGKNSISYPGRRTTVSSIIGVVVSNTDSRSEARPREVFAPVVINAAGVWADEIRQWTGSPPRLRRLRGSHLVIPAQRLPLNRAVNLFHPRDGRPVFAYNWEGVTIVGTTDVDHDDQLVLDPAISEAEAAYLLEFIQIAFPGQEITRSDIQATFSGIRPVVNTGKVDPSKESREHVLWIENGMLTVTGGKLTTFRLMAREALRLIRKRLPGNPTFPKNHRLLNPVDREILLSPDVLSSTMRLRLFGRYGSQTPNLVEAARPGEFESVEGSAATWAELRWAARSEGALHLDDLLLRRVRLGILLPEGGLKIMDQIRSIVQPEMNWDDPTWQSELSQYTRLWHDSYSIS